MLPFEAQSPAEVATELARRLRALRLQRGWTQAEAAARSGMTLASYKRFERTGEIAFKSMLKIALAFEQLGRLEVFWPLGVADNREGEVLFGNDPGGSLPPLSRPGEKTLDALERERDTRRACNTWVVPGQGAAR